MKIILVFLFLITSCAQNTPKDIVRGYPESDYSKIASALAGKNPNQVIKYLGKPAIASECLTCAKGGLYRMIYPTKNMQRFYLEISYNTDVELECTVVDLYPVGKKKGVYAYKKGTKLRKFLRCNQKDGVIIQLQNQE